MMDAATDRDAHEEPRGAEGATHADADRMRSAATLLSAHSSERLDRDNARHAASRGRAPHVDHLTRVLGSDAHMQRAVWVVKVEPIKGRALGDPARDLAALDPRHQEVRGRAEA